jgi:hypothetical protein
LFREKEYRKEKVRIQVETLRAHRQIDHRRKRRFLSISFEPASYSREAKLFKKMK